MNQGGGKAEIRLIRVLAKGWCKVPEGIREMRGCLRKGKKRGRGCLYILVVVVVLARKSAKGRRGIGGEGR